MRSYKDSIPVPFPHLNAPLAGLSPHHDAETAFTVEGPSPDANTTRRRHPNRFDDAFSCDEFRMYYYKVRRCLQGKSHDWTSCPFAHRGEKARRRDPRKIHYSGDPCPDFRKGSCRRGDACVYAHGIFESWLHPARYRTQPCKDGRDCKRKVCFFAHSMQQLRHAAAPTVEESLAARDSHVHTPYSHVQELESSSVSMDSMEDFVFLDGASMVEDSYEHEWEAYKNYEVGMAVPTVSSALPSLDVCIHVGSVSETESMLTWSSQTQDLSGSPYEPIFPNEFPSRGVPLQMLPPYPNLASVAMGSPSAGVSVISTNNPSSMEQAIMPAVCSSRSLLQQVAARQTFMMHEASSYGKEEESYLNVTADEVSDMVQHGGYGDTAHSLMCVPRRGRSDANELANGLKGLSKLICSTEQLALLRKEPSSSYSFCGSYGLSSPTSTLAEPFHRSPFSSPSLSPLIPLSSNTSNIFSSRGHGNVQVDDRIPIADAHILSSHNQQVGYGARFQYLESPSFSHCTAIQNKWIPMGGDWNADGTDNHGIMRDSVRQNSWDGFGGECLEENLLPDVRWVSELVM